MITELSQTGSWHKRNGVVNQDFIFSRENNGLFVIALADGVSSCEQADVGAKVASTSLAEFLLQQGRTFLTCENGNAVSRILSCVLDKIRQQAVTNGKDAVDYSSTLAGIMADQKSGKMFFFNLGDSLILTIAKDRCSVLSMPGDSTNGCYVTTTINAAVAVDSGVVDVNLIDSVSIFSDGAWKQMFDKNRMKSEVKDMLLDSSSAIREYLMTANSFDDCSFISLDLRKAFGRKAA